MFTVSPLSARGTLLDASKRNLLPAAQDAVKPPAYRDMARLRRILDKARLATWIDCLPVHLAGVIILAGSGIKLIALQNPLFLSGRRGPIWKTNDAWHSGCRVYG